MRKGIVLVSGLLLGFKTLASGVYGVSVEDGKARGLGDPRFCGQKHWDHS